MKVGIIGGGIGGLTLALALHQKKIPFTLFEAAPEIRAVGAGILLGPNAMLLLDRLGVGETIREAGQSLRAAHICDADFRPMQTLDMVQIRAAYGSGSTLIHRGALQRCLLEQLPAEAVQTGYQAVRVEPSSGNVFFANGSNDSFEVVIGADGIHSAVRQSVFPNRHTRSSGQICWRGVANYSLPDRLKESIHECWGKMGRFATCDLGKGQVYWFAVAREKDIPEAAFPNMQDEVLNLFAEFAEPARAVLEATPADAIHRDVLADLPSQSPWWDGQVCMIGDAIHATTPNLGQGGAQAIEDAWYLAELLSAMPEDPSAAFARFEGLRTPKVSHVVNQSWQVGQLAHWKSPLAVMLRNTIMRLTPTRVMTRQVGRVYRLVDL
jgi:2-polyprenyl-6-methoxyphenol hydroxylase-like FAD-dependent oxidoreductase